MVTMKPAAAKKFEMISTAVQVFIVLVVCLGGVDRADAVREKDDGRIRMHRFLASVREYPLLQHKCMATFVTPSSLLTTASCVLCSKKCNLYIRIVTGRMDDPIAPMYKVQSTKYNPRYNSETQEHDFGLIFLKRGLSGVTPLALPSDNYQFSGAPAYIYKWHSSEEKNYHLKKIKLKTISNDICSKIMYYYFSSTYLCAYGERQVTLGQYDQGSPVVSKGTTILGIHSQNRVEVNMQVTVYLSIFPDVHWIQHNMSPSKITNSSYEETDSDITSLEEQFLPGTENRRSFSFQEKPEKRWL